MNQRRPRRRERLVATTLVVAWGILISVAGVNLAEPEEVPKGLPPVPVPAANPLTAEKVALGKRLFFEPRLSLDGTVSCASCHRPDVAFADTARFSLGVEGRRAPRNTPSILNAAYLPRLISDGRSPDLEDQVRYPITHPNEMSMTRKRVVEALENATDYKALFAAAYGDPEITFDRVAWALASFERTLVTEPAPFDRFAAGETTAISPLAKRGWELFRGDAGCIQCHRWEPERPFFTDFQFHNTGIGWDQEDIDLGRYRITRDKQDRGRFKTPSLRNIARTPPYMHDGRFDSLAQVVEFYVAGGFANRYLDPLIRPLDLTPEDRRALIRFLETLTSPSASSGGLASLVGADPAGGRATAKGANP